MAIFEFQNLTDEHLKKMIDAHETITSIMGEGFDDEECYNELIAEANKREVEEINID